jgi:hypothetical protein
MHLGEFLQTMNEPHDSQGLWEDSIGPMLHEIIDILLKDIACEANDR